MKHILVSGLLIAAALTGPSATAQGLGDVDWCLCGDATNRIQDQPMDQGYCAWVAAGTAVGVWYAPQYAGVVLSSTQREWSRYAANLAKNVVDSSAQAAAVGLLAACQCHNQAAADWIVNNPAAVLGRLRQFTGCPISSSKPSVKEWMAVGEGDASHASSGANSGVAISD